MFKIQLANNEYYASKLGRVQHYRSIEKADAKIQKLGEIATGATVVECKTKTTAATKEESIEIASDAKVPKVNKTKKVSSKAKKTDKTATDEKVASGKTKKPKKAPSND